MQLGIRAIITSRHCLQKNEKQQMTIFEHIKGIRCKHVNDRLTARSTHNTPQI